ncbi:MAG TPA: class I SAM-dependent methyltransferase [Gammaproteobacteria bacterium]|nr:class I SAM-dependent methyltransferase [Gammaproteobacteria bacterium]
MNQLSDNSRLISHNISTADLNQIVKEKAEKIKSAGDKPYASVDQQLELLHELTQFDFGRFLLCNKGINGYWTHYMLTYPWQPKKARQNRLEAFILERAPTVLATQERFRIFLSENQKLVSDNNKLACIPSGMMGELLYLDYSSITDIHLVGIDYDHDTLDDAKKLAQEKSLLKFTQFEQADAWQLNLDNEFDLISSNGLNIYEPNESKVVALYQQFYNALKSDGKLVTSFLTPPPQLTTDCEWNMGAINQQDLLLQKIIFVDIIEAKWQCFHSSQFMQKHLEAIGFNSIQFIYDKAKLFPTVIATK